MNLDRIDDNALFADRLDAGRRLAERLLIYKKRAPIILGIPRGGVAVAYEAARALEAPLDVIVARKLGAPRQPELGIGAIAPGDVCILDHELVRVLGLTDRDMEPIVGSAREEMEQQLDRFREGRQPLNLRGRLVIVIDDGVATGVTTRAAIRSIRQMNPENLVLAIPVCPPVTAHSLAEEVDAFICLSSPGNFRAVGEVYHDFTQVTDEEVIGFLREARRAPSRRVIGPRARISGVSRRRTLSTKRD